MKLEVNNNEEEIINNKIRRNKKTIFKENKRYIDDENDINSYQNIIFVKLILFSFLKILVFYYIMKEGDF